MPPAMAEMQNQLHRLGWEVGCVNSNQSDGSIVWHLVAKRGDQELRVKLAGRRLLWNTTNIGYHQFVEEMMLDQSDGSCYP